MDFFIVNIIIALSALGMITLPQSFISGLLLYSNCIFVSKCVIALIIIIVVVCKNKNKDNLGTS